MSTFFMKSMLLLSFLLCLNVLVAECAEQSASSAQADASVAPPAAASPAAQVVAAPSAPEAVAPPAPATPAAVAAPGSSAPAASPASSAPATPPTTVDLSGQWKSKITDNVALEQKGNTLVGEYIYKDDMDVTIEGKIEATIEGGIIKGKWYERPKVGKGDEERGVLEWKIVENGKMLAGWFMIEGEKEKEDWNLER